MKRFYCPDFSTGVLGEEESHHAIHVMRLAVGENFTVFNGEGVEGKAKITAVEGDCVRFSVLAKASTAKTHAPIWLGQAITKPKSMDLILQKATELGVSTIFPLQSDRCVAHVDDEKAESKVEKWQKLVLEASKQSGQNWLPKIHLPHAPKKFLQDVPKNAIRLIASLQPEARPMKTVLREVLPTRAAGAPIVVLIGPEGDFTPAETGEARAAGFSPISLGPIILRAETAAFFVLSALAYELMDEKRA